MTRIQDARTPHSQIWRPGTIPWAPVALAIVAALVPTAASLGQAAAPTAFILENVSDGIAVVSIDADGIPTAVTTAATSDGPQCGALSPNGRWLAVGHGTISSTVEAFQIFEIAADGTPTLAHEITVPDSPLDCGWIDDGVLVIGKSGLGDENRAQIYAWDPEGPALTLVDAADAGSFHTSIAIHPTERIVYGQDSFGSTIRWWSVDADGLLSPTQSIGTGGVFPLDLHISPDGRTLYAAGGISDDGDKVLAFDIARDGSLSPAVGSPYVSPGVSPAYVAVPEGGAFAAVGHGTDATVRTFARDPETGALAPTGFGFDVGQQGTIGDVTPFGSRLLVTDESTAFDGIAGLYVFEIGSDGSLTATAPILMTGGVRPEVTIAWIPPDVGPAGDVDGDGDVDFGDLLAVLAAWGSSDPDADVDGSGLVDFTDLVLVLSDWTD